MNEEEFRAVLLNKLDLNNRLQALNLVKDKPSLREKIEDLSSLGIGPSEIAEILGTSSNYVNVTLNRIRKSHKKEESEASSQDDNKTNDEIPKTRT